MNLPSNWSATAFNTSPDSPNRIHSDEMAQQYGFRGGLVPGVTVSAYLIHPAVEAWGEEWLECGRAETVVHKPLYDGVPFDVLLADITLEEYRAELIDAEGTHNASGVLTLSKDAPPPPTRRGDALLPGGKPPIQATRDSMERLRDEGMQALEFTWSDGIEMSSYLASPADMPGLHRFEEGAFANAAFMLGLTNWVLAGNVYMNPWIHLQTTSQNYAAVAAGTTLVVECGIADLFEKKGHEFVDLDVEIYERDSDRPVMTAMLRAIYRLRAS